MAIERYVPEINGKYIYGIYYVENIINNTGCNGGQYAVNKVSQNLAD